MLPDGRYLYFISMQQKPGVTVDRIKIYQFEKDLVFVSRAIHIYIHITNNIIGDNTRGVQKVCGPTMKICLGFRVGYLKDGVQG